jgi:ADP-ribosyl-[dinitrogen reductase] hydrolase
MPDASENTFLGALIGMAIGDALGAPVAGLHRDEIAAQFGRITDFLPIPDPEGDHSGEFTDETEIALCIVESMTANQGRLDPETAGVRMLYLASGPSRRWMQSATLAALDAASESLNFVVPVDEDGPATGDVASRGVPVGLTHAVAALHPESLSADAEAAVRLTHGGPAAFNAATAVAFVTRLAATGVPRSEWARETAAFVGSGEISARLFELDRLIQDAEDLPTLIGKIGTGLDACESVPAAFGAAMMESSFEEAVFAAVNAGGATDTVGAITGALAGAANGASGIPQRLIDGLEGRIYISLAAPWLYKAARQRAGQIINLRPIHGRRPDAPPRV